MKIIISNADYSNTGLGSTDWITNFLADAGITSPAQKTAVRTLYSDMVTQGIWAKVKGVCFYPGASAASQKYVFNENRDQIIFSGTVTNAAGGFNPTLNGYATAPFTPPAGVFDLQLGCYNTTPDIQTAQHALMGAKGENTGGVADYTYSLYRSYTTGANQAQVAIINQQSISGATLTNNTGTYPTTGFLQVSKIGTQQTLLNDATTLRQLTIAHNPTGGGAVKLQLGGAFGLTIGIRSDCNRVFDYWGSTGLTVAEMVAFNTSVHAFLTSFGRI